MTGINIPSTERLNEHDAVHQLEYLSCRLRVTKSIGGDFKRKKFWWKGRAKVRKMYIEPDFPISLNYFTIEQLLYIIHDISENYLRTTHIFAFGNERFLIKVVPNDDDGTDKASIIKPPYVRRLPVLKTKADYKCASKPIEKPSTENL